MVFPRQIKNTLTARVQASLIQGFPIIGFFIYPFSHTWIGEINDFCNTYAVALSGF